MWPEIFVTTIFVFGVVLSSTQKRSVPVNERKAGKEFEVRLSRGFAHYAGQVVVFHQGVWSTVCDDAWDESDAFVVCRELGYPNVTLVTRGSFFGQAGTINFEKVRCNGNETRLGQCYHKTSTPQSNCKTGWRREAGVICEPAKNADPRDLPRVRLSNLTNSEGSGLVEVFMHGQWGRVCDYSWDFDDASVVCRQLGYPGAEHSTCCGMYFGKGTGPPLMARVDCSGTEASIFHCSHVGKDDARCSRRSSAGVVCKLNKPNVRLVGSHLAHAGFAQIRHNGRWGSFCDWDWGLEQGHVICRELGYRRALFTTLGGVFERQSGPIWIEEAQCHGNESSIFKCDLTYIRDMDEVYGCDHSHDGGVICESEKESGSNETAAVRLQGGNSTYMGGVEIQQHEIWHSVCSIAWDKHDADVVCRQLGFPEAVVELAHGQFGSKPGPMWLTSVHCHGNETSLDQCVSAGWEIKKDCGERYGAGVICKTENVTGDGEIRLSGSSEVNEGRVEIKLGGIWGTVSDLEWDLREGHVVCRQLGYRQAVRVYSHSRYGSVDKKILLSNLDCTGEEDSLLGCHRELNFRLYSPGDNAGVQCTNDTNYKSDVEVRLSGADTPNYGHVQVKFNGTWGTICTMRDLPYPSAEVICRQLGLGPALKQTFMNDECTAVREGAETVWLSSLNCQGFEDSVDQCPHRGWGKLDPEYCLGCTPKHCSACLICQPVTTNTTDISLRMAGSNLPHAGRVEVQYAGVWGVICPRFMSGTVFKVICRQLGFEDVMGDVTFYGRRRRTPLYGKGKGPVWLSKVQCHGNESNLSECVIVSPGEILWCSHTEALELMCRPKNYRAPYPVRLAGSSVPHAGLVEVLYNGTWGTVCSNVYQWDVSTPNALVVCRQLGFGPPLRSASSWLAPVFSNCASREHATGPIWLSNVKCQGNESSVDQCPSLGWGKTERHCSHTSDTCLVCYNSRYQNSEIALELTGSQVPYAGRVKVRYQGVWGTFCSDEWQHEIAEVICRQLGFDGVELDLTLNNIDEYNRPKIYDVGPGPVWFRSSGCKGHEKNLSECDLTEDRYCLEDNVELICKMENVSVNEFAVRLHGGSHSNEGRVEVFYGGLWGTVRTSKWDLTDAMVFCRQLGFPKAQATSYKQNDLSKQVFWFSNFECDGSEATLGQCKHTRLGKALYNDDEPLEVFVRCAPGTANNTSKFFPTPAASIAGLKTTSVTSKQVPPNTANHVPSQTYTSQGPLSTLAPSTTGPPISCPRNRCQNGGSCELAERSWECRCLETFSGDYCEVNVGSNAVSMILKMTLNQWKPFDFKKTLADLLTSHCKLNSCLAKGKKLRTKRLINSPSFRPDDVIILQGYPKQVQGTSLLNVRLAVKMPGDNNNTVISREGLHRLLVKVAPGIHRRLGHEVAYIDKTDVHSAPISSVQPLTAPAVGRESNGREFSTSHSSALIALGVALGIVSLIAIIMIILYYRKVKREEVSFDQEDPDADEKPGENIRLMAL